LSVRRRAACAAVERRLCSCLLWCGRGRHVVILFSNGATAALQFQPRPSRNATRFSVLRAFVVRTPSNYHETPLFSKTSAWASLIYTPPTRPSGMGGSSGMRTVRDSCARLSLRHNRRPALSWRPTIRPHLIAPAVRLL
jgi:hypothetical protein